MSDSDKRCGTCRHFEPKFKYDRTFRKTPNADGTCQKITTDTDNRATIYGGPSDLRVHEKFGCILWEDTDV